MIYKFSLEATRPLFMEHDLKDKWDEYIACDTYEQGKQAITDRLVSAGWTVNHISAHVVTVLDVRTNTILD